MEKSQIAEYIDLCTCILSTTPNNIQRRDENEKIEKGDSDHAI